MDSLDVSDSSSHSAFAMVRGPSLVFITVAAAIIRVVVVLAQPVHLINDSADYQRLAVSLAHGHGFGISTVAPGGGPTAFRPPLFPLVLSVIYRLVGVHVLAARLVEAVLGVAVVVLIAVLSAALWGRTIGLVSAAIAAIYPSLVMASTSLMSESVSLPLNLTAILAAVLYRRSRRWQWLLVSGAALGLAVLARPNVAVLGISAALLVWSARPAAWRLIPPLALLAVAAVVVSPWLIRDRLVMHSWIPLTTQDGLVLAGTYNHTSYADPRLPAAWRPATLDPAVSALVRSHPNAGEVQLNAMLQHAAATFIRQHPAYPLKVAAYNTARLVDLSGINYVCSAVENAYGYPAAFGDAEIAGCIALLLLAIIGVLSVEIRRTPRAYWTAPILLWLTMSLIEVLPRYRAVIDPYLVQVAAAGVVLIWRQLLRYQQREAVRVE